MKIVISDPRGFEDEHMSMIFDMAGEDTVTVPLEDDLVGELADAEVFFGFHTPEIFPSAADLCRTSSR